MAEPSQDAIQAAYEYACEDRRHYDNLIWNTIAVALAVNAFLVGAALDLAVGRLAKVAHLLLAAFFMLVFFMALTKHRLFLREREVWRQNLEGSLALAATLRRHTPEELSRLDSPNSTRWPRIAEYYRMWRRLCANVSVFRWLCSLVFVSSVMDLVIAVYIAVWDRTAWFEIASASGVVP